MKKTAKKCRLLRENGNDIAVFDTHSLGLYTGRDTYAYNFSRDELRKHMGRLIDTFNGHLEKVWRGEITKENVEEKVEKDQRTIKWDSSLKDRLLRLREKQAYTEEKVYPAFYRPFVPMWVYFDGVFNGSIRRLPSIFPASDTENLAIVVSGKGSDWFDAFITDRIVDYGFMYNTQIFPLYIYTETFQKQYNISDNTLRLFQEELRDTTITKEDIFFYVFGLLSTPFCVKRFRNNLSKELPRVPILKRFREISKFGRMLAGVQLIYQQYVWAVVMKEEKRGFVDYTILEDDELLLLWALFYPLFISQAFMRRNVITKEEAAKKSFPILIDNGSNIIEYVEKVKLDEENRELLINEKVKVRGIPEFALKFKIGNCSPIEWVSRYLVRQEDKETGIVWDPMLRVEELVDIVKKLIAFSEKCLWIKQSLEELYFMSDKSREEEKILNEVFNLDFHEFLDEYTDKGSGKDSGQLPDFYLLSKEEGLPNLAIEVKTLRRDHDRPADYETPPEVEEHHLAVKDFHFVLKLHLLGYKNPPTIKVKGGWYSLKEKLDKYKEKWEYVLDRISDIEKLLENEDEEIYVKDLPREKKQELRKIIDDIKRQDERFVKSLPSYILFPYTCLATHPEICQIKIKDVEGKIKESKEKGLSRRVADFIWYHFMDELKDFPKNYIMRVKEEGVKDGSIFITTRFIITMEPEDPVFHIKEIERYVEESKGKFENLRKVKSDKSDDSPHWELLLVKGLLVADRDFNPLTEEIEAELTKKGYDGLLLVRKRKEGEDAEVITIEIKNNTVRCLDGSWDGIYYLIIRMGKEMEVSEGYDWKTQIMRILNKV